MIQAGRCPILTTADRISKLILVSQASGNNLAKGMHYSFQNLKVFSFVLFSPLPPPPTKPHSQLTADKFRDFDGPKN